MNYCDEIFPEEDNELEDLERFVTIYKTTPDLGSYILGVVYDQQRYLASFPMTSDNTESVQPVDEHEDI